MTEELWKDIDGFEGFYQVSNLGRLKSLDRTIVDSNGTSRRLKGLYMRPIVNGSGYLQCKLNKDGVRYQPFLHKLVAESFIKNSFNLKEVNHINHNKLDCHVGNLEWCTRKENMIKMVEFYGLKSSKKYCISDNCDKEVCRKNTYCKVCTSLRSRKVERPSKDELLNLIKTKSFVEIGIMFSVSDNSIRKWCKYYNIPHRKTYM